MLKTIEMPLTTKVFSYALWLLPVIDLIGFFQSFDIGALVRVAIGVAVAYFTMTWSLKVGGVYYALGTLLTVGVIWLIWPAAPLWTFFIAAFAAVGCYVLLFKKPTEAAAPIDSQNEPGAD